MGGDDGDETVNEDRWQGSDVTVGRIRPYAAEDEEVRETLRRLGLTLGIGIRPVAVVDGDEVRLSTGTATVPINDLMDLAERVTAMRRRIDVLESGYLEAPRCSGFGKGK